MSIRVLRVVGSFDPAFGGPSVSALNSCIAATRAGIATAVACPVPRHGARAVRVMLDKLRRERTEVLEFPLAEVGRDLARRWAISIAFLRWIRGHARDYDLLHCHSAWSFVSLVGTFVGNAKARPVLLSPHESLTAFGMRTGRWQVRVGKAALRRVYARWLRRVVFASRLEYRDSLAGLPPDKCTWVPHAVYDERRNGRGSAAGTVEGEEFRLGFLGRLHPKKNCDVVIRSLQQLPDAVSVVIGGQGTAAYEQELRDLAVQAGVDERVRFVGFVGEQQKRDFFASIDVLVMPSAYECFGMAVAEALMFGRPVIVSRETGISDVVEQYRCGAVVAPEASAVAEAVHALERDRATAREMGTRASMAAAREFSFGRHGEKLRDEYESICA